MRPEMVGSLLLAALLVTIEVRIWRREFKAKKAGRYHDRLVHRGS